MSDIERIGDHIDQLCNISLKRHKTPESMVDKESFDGLLVYMKRQIKSYVLLLIRLDPSKRVLQNVPPRLLMQMMNITT